MSSIIYLKALTNPSLTPCLVLVDMQREYISETRLMAVPEANTAISNCRNALEHARKYGLPVAFVRQTSRSPYFNPATTHANWIDGFTPTRDDMIFEREKPSCYANKLFADLMESVGGHFVMAGFAGETACLSTAVDAFHRNHRFTYLSDASASHGIGTASAKAIHATIASVIGVYGKVSDTSSWIAESSDSIALLEG